MENTIEEFKVRWGLLNLAQKLVQESAEKMGWLPNGKNGQTEVPPVNVAPPPAPTLTMADLDRYEATKAIALGMADAARESASIKAKKARKKMDMRCRFAGCSAKSKGPRYHFLCEQHVGK
jgi:hypothetical protein